MAGIKMTINGSGNGFKVDDACTSDSTACAATWDGIFGAMAVQDADSFKLTARYHENEELPPMEESVEINSDE
jgi:hypothetical protein